MKTEPAQIHIKRNAIPYARHSPIPVPHHWKATIKEGLDEDVRRGIIKPVEYNTPVQWCSPMVTKPDGSPRRTIDFQKLNAECARETHHCASPFNLASQVPPNKLKTVIDAVDGYHAIELDKDSQHLTTFITEWGRYQYLRVPQGFVGSGDIYNKRYDDIIAHVDNKVKIVDDALLYEDSIEDSFFQAWDYLTLLAENGIVASIPKFQFCQEIANFGGLKITMDGVVPSDSMIESITRFSAPTDLISARAGLA